ncbi:MAG: hypothetical protein WD872_13835 [Pirellulaceae bacterium]
MLPPSESVQTGYWRVEIISRENPGDEQCVLLHGQEEEICGPMSRELAEAWMERFDGQPKVAAAPAKPRPVVAHAAKPRKRAPLSRRKRPAERPAERPAASPGQAAPGQAAPVAAPTAAGSIEVKS